MARKANTDTSPPRSALDAGVDTLPGIGPKRAETLRNLGIETVRDLLSFFPRDYQDRRHVQPIAAVEAGETVTIEAEVVEVRSQHLRKRLAVTEAVLEDATGSIKASWFGPAYMAKAFPPGTRGFFYGPVADNKGLTLQNPEYELLAGDDEDRLHTGRIVPIYRLSAGLSQRLLRKWMSSALELLKDGVEESLPLAVRKRRGFPPLAQAIRDAHFPEDLDAARAAKARFVYEELLGMQLGIVRVRQDRLRSEDGHAHRMGGPVYKELRASLPFKPTRAQERAISDVLTDMAAPRPMMRLLQGDVGCGKTLVAIHAIAVAADGDFQTAVLAPTEILAEQHARTLRERLEPMGLAVELLTRSTPDAKEARRRIARGDSPVVVGTHALIQEKVEFHNLGLVVIDEQHRFGVLQRLALTAKGRRPDVLHMTATPIPRTLALTLYGGMDISTIDELPPGRSPIKTSYVSQAQVPRLYGYIREQAEKGFQTYLVCPLVEESDASDLKSVIRHYEELSSTTFAGLRTELLHGRMPGPEKDEIMRRFKSGAIDILFSTTVIEVGIDVPTATTIVIEDAGQFGLTQLHQLRGRVGRGPHPSYCFLVGKPRTPDAKRRIEILCRTQDGFVIAEEDLNLRGPGELVGVRQAGLMDLLFVDLIRDARLIDEARRDAERVLEADPSLGAAVHRHLARAAQRFARLNG